jgi:hypothetical protein
MQMYEHIVWTLEDTTCDVKKIMGTDIVRKINKDKELLMQNGFSFGYEELTVNNLQDFVDQVYVPVIGQRKNQRVERILTVLTPEEIQTHKRQFIFIRQGDKLL